MLRKMPRQPQFTRHAGSIDRAYRHNVWKNNVWKNNVWKNNVWKNSAWPELKTQAIRSCRGCERFRLDRVRLQPEGSTVRDHSTASREPWAPTALGRACAPHYWRHPGRGLRPRPPSSRFHGFDPHEPNGPAPRIAFDSLTFSIE